MKQLTWISIVHSGDWCLRLVLCTHSCACQKWTNEWMWIIHSCFHWYKKNNILRRNTGSLVQMKWRVLYGSQCLTWRG